MVPKLIKINRPSNLGGLSKYNANLIAVKLYRLAGGKLSNLGNLN